MDPVEGPKMDMEGVKATGSMEVQSLKTVRVMEMQCLWPGVVFVCFP